MGCSDIVLEHTGSVLQITFITRWWQARTRASADGWLTVCECRRVSEPALCLGKLLPFCAAVENALFVGRFWPSCRNKTVVERKIFQWTPRCSLRETDWLRWMHRSLLLAPPSMGMWRLACRIYPCIKEDRLSAWVLAGRSWSGQNVLNPENAVANSMVYTDTILSCLSTSVNLCSASSRGWMRSVNVKLHKCSTKWTDEESFKRPSENLNDTKCVTIWSSHETTRDPGQMIPSFFTVQQHSSNCPIPKW